MLLGCDGREGKAVSINILLSRGAGPMTVQEQLILVCEKLLGWKHFNRYLGSDKVETGIWKGFDEYGKLSELPPLTLDLMWECEKRLAHLYPNYVQELFKLAPNDPDLDPRTLWPLIHATAEQRLAALVETIGGMK